LSFFDALKLSGVWVAFAELKYSPTSWRLVIQVPSLHLLPGHAMKYHTQEKVCKVKMIWIMFSVRRIRSTL